MAVLFTAIWVMSLLVNLASAGTELEYLYQEPEHKLARCQGDCDVDDDCQSYLVCWHQDAWVVAPGCHGEVTYPGADYCVLPGDYYTFSPTINPTPYPTLNLVLESVTAEDCDSSYELGVFSSAAACATWALFTDECDVSGDTFSIMWHDQYSTYSSAWGCHCCRSDAVITESPSWSWTLRTYSNPNSDIAVEAMSGDDEPLTFGNWLWDGVRFLEIPDKVPTLFVLAVVLLVVAAVAAVRCSQSARAQKPYKRVSFGDATASDVETDVDQAIGA